MFSRHLIGLVVCFSFCTFALFCNAINDVYDVIIVGAGISGLSAADTLRKNGVEKVLILEAADRIGGRVWTTGAWGSSLELGASWIHGIENSPLFDVVRDMNLTIQPTIYNNTSLPCKMNSMVIYDPEGNRLSESELTTLKEQIEKFEKHLVEMSVLCKNNNLTYMDGLNDFAQKNLFLPQEFDRFYFILRLLNTYEMAVDLENMPISAEELYKKTKVSGTNGIIPLGYNLVASKLAKNLSIELNAKVDKISYENPLIECCVNQRIFRAKHCIVTVPLGVLQANTIAFSPSLSTELQDSIRKIQIGVFDKVYLFFPYVFWDRDVEWIEAIPANSSRDEIFDIMNFGKYFKQPILLVFTAGSFAKEAENWSDEKMVSRIMSVLKKIYGNDIPSPSSHLMTRWHKDPLFLGSYSCPGLEADEQTYALLAKPVNERLFFAGEATSQTDCSTVLGAFTSGQRAAQQILRGMGIKPRENN